MRDGSGFIYSANDESPNDFHLYRYDLASKKATRLYAAEGTWSADDVTVSRASKTSTPAGSRSARAGELVSRKAIATAAGVKVRRLHMVLSV